MPDDAPQAEPVTTAPRVDFYLIQTGDADRRLLTVCRLASKVYELGHPLVIRCDSDAQCRRLDERLWTFHPGSFVPHEVVTDATAACEAPIRITTACPPPPGEDAVLINLGRDIPEGHAAYSRIAEVVDERDEAVRQACRAHYRQYQERTYPLEVHRL